MSASKTQKSRSRARASKPTRWRLASTAAAGPKSASFARRREAIEHLAGDYWPPLYAFLRRSGLPPEPAAKVTREFFARLIDKKFLGGPKKAREKFRTFLLAALEKLELKEFDKPRLPTRTAAAPIIDLNIYEAERMYERMAPERSTPEGLFNRRWAMGVLERVVFSLQRDYAEQGKGALFDALRPALTSDIPGAYPALAGRLGMKEADVRAAAQHLRQSYRRMLREKIAQTIANESMIEDEIRELFSGL